MAETTEQSLREVWKKRIEAIPRTWVNLKELAGAIEASYGKVKNDLHLGKIPHYQKMGSEGSSAEVRIPKWSAIEYIETFSIVEERIDKWPRLKFPD